MSQNPKHPSAAQPLDPEELPYLEQFLTLACRQCGQQDRYDVGVILCHPPAAGEKADDTERYSFRNYFRCKHCQGPGPFDIVSQAKLLPLMVQAMTSKRCAGFRFMRAQTFDGLSFQTLALAEEHLKELLAKDPRNSFLCTRLGNLLRGARQFPASQDWYEKAVTLNPGDLEARYHLHDYAARHENFSEALAQTRLLLDQVLKGQNVSSPNQGDITSSLVFETLRNLRYATTKTSSPFRIAVKLSAATGKRARSGM